MLSDDRIGKLASAFLADLARTHGAAARFGVARAAIRQAALEATESARGDTPPPVSAAREAEIRRIIPDDEYKGRSGGAYTSAIRDLLALLDHERARADQCEALCARFAVDTHAVQVGERIGVAKALAVIDEAIVADSGREHSILCVLRNDVLTACGPALLPPHLVTLAGNRRMRAALLEIIEANDLPATVRRIARAALGEEAGS